MALGITSEIVSDERVVVARDRTAPSNPGQCRERLVQVLDPQSRHREAAKRPWPSSQDREAAVAVIARPRSGRGDPDSRAEAPVGRGRTMSVNGGKRT
jgi:hypothetical protein